MEPKVYHGKNIDDAIKTACQDLNVERSEINVDVVDPGKRGFLGFGKKPATIKVSFLKDMIAHLQKPDLNDDELTKIPFTPKDQEAVKMIEQMLTEIFEQSQIAANVSYQVKDEQIIFKIESDQYKGLIIGKKGKTINSLQAIAQTIFLHHGESRYYVILDIDNYRELRSEQIKTWLDQAVRIVRHSGKSYRFSPMIAVERKVIINYLDQLNDINFRVRGSYPRKYIEIFRKFA